MSRKPTTEEIRIHQLALSRPDLPLVDKDVAGIIPDPQARANAMNFLTGAGLFKVLQDKKQVQWKVVMKQELDQKKGLTQDENMVLSHISASENRGVWTKQLKAKTELHQTVLDRCLKTLTSKGLVKTVKSVQHSTRKIYMLAHLEPSIELTGGPWYTDNELDSEFIRLLCNACLFYIKECSFPAKKKQKNQDKHAVYAISDAPAYPSAKDVLDKLSKTKVSTTQLDVEHVESLLNVLVLDGEIEKIPAFGAAMWDATPLADDSGSDEESDAPTQKKSKKRSKSSDSRKKRKRQKDSGFDASDSSDSDSEAEAKSKKSKSKKKKRKEYASSDDNDSDDNSDDQSSKKRKKSKKKKSKADSDDSDSEEEEKKRKKKKKRKSRQDSDSSEAESSTASESSPPRKSKKKSKAKVKEERESSPMGMMSGAFSTAYVYRAIRQEKITSMGFLQAPCSACPVFEFCKDKGPVNPGECDYFTTWLERNPGEAVEAAEPLESFLA